MEWKTHLGPADRRVRPKNWLNVYAPNSPPSRSNQGCVWCIQSGGTSGNLRGASTDPEVQMLLERLARVEGENKRLDS